MNTIWILWILLRTTNSLLSSPEPPPLTTALLRISYDGRHFTGWSAANDPKEPLTDKEINQIPSRSSRSRRRRRGGPGFVRSVQGVVRRCLAKLYGNVAEDRIILEGCSRTDKGVHASSMIAQFYCLQDHLPDQIDTWIDGKRMPHPANATDASYFCPLRQTLPDLQYKLNRMLPEDVRIMALAPSPEYFHPTRSTKTKTYHYTVSVGRIHDPNAYKTAWQVDATELNLSAIHAACQILQGTHDFCAFSATPSSSQDRARRFDKTVCTLYDIDWQQTTTTNHDWHFAETFCVSVTGDRFLYKMVRLLVGALVAVGQGKLTTDQIQTMLDEPRNKRQAFTCAPAHGLVLYDVEYEKEIAWE